jgi:dihydrodipicolinate synthase/N-acetylneuraminate lyase
VVAEKEVTAMGTSLPRGIVPVLQTGFDERGAIDFHCSARLIENALAGGASGFLVPAVASEVGTLEPSERENLVRFVVQRVGGRVPIIAGCTAVSAEECAKHAEFAQRAGATAYLISPPDELRDKPDDLLSFFRRAGEGVALPLIVQDLDWAGPGLSLETIARLRRELPQFAGIKVESVPAGPKYTLVREACGADFHISGGWAIAQMIEAMDRGVDALIPEASMVSVYSAIWRLHHAGRRAEAVKLFRELLPVVAFTNQEIRLCIAFFKGLLVRKGIFTSETMRLPGFEWDGHSRKIAEELIEYYLELETRATRR